MNIENKRGPMMEPQGIPMATGLGSNNVPMTETRCFLATQVL